MNYENVPSIASLREFSAIHPLKDVAECIDPITGTSTSLAIVGEHTQTHHLTIIPLAINADGNINALVPEGEYILHFLIDRTYKIAHQRLLKDKLKRQDDIYAIRIGHVDQTYAEYNASGNTSMTNQTIKQLLLYFAMDPNRATELDHVLLPIGIPELYAPIDILILQSYTDLRRNREQYIPEGLFTIHFQSLL